MKNISEFREQTAQELLTFSPNASKLSAFVGLDGFVDEIIHVVDKRSRADQFSRLATLDLLSERIAAAAGRSTNIELVPRLTKIGGNGPIMANALARLGLKVTYLGALGFPTLHPVFDDFARTSEVHSIAEAAHTDALEFDDGKLMLGKITSLNDVTWANINARYGHQSFADKVESAHLVAFVNWTMVPHMTDIWEAILREICPRMSGARRHLFFDLADPEKRQPQDIRRALRLISRFESYFKVTLGLNEKEANELADVLGLDCHPSTPEGLGELARRLHQEIPVHTILIHPVAYALAVSGNALEVVDGPYVPNPVITTGAGDHFNSGFCLGRLLGLNTAASLLLGVAASGHYVRTAESPSIGALAEMLRQWPQTQALATP